MLNTLLPSPAPRPPSPISNSPRRRGGQPSNRNAFKHGLYAFRNALPLTHLANSIKNSHPGLEIIPEILEGSILLLRGQIARLFESSPKGTDLRSILAWHRPIHRLLGLFLRVERILARHRRPLLHLEFVAAHALELIHYDFLASGILRDAYSFREKNKKSDFNSFQEYPELSFSDSRVLFLTARQWGVLEPLVPPFDHLSTSPSFTPRQMCFSTGEGSGEAPSMGVRRGRLPVNPLPLLDAALWKIAHHARWQDLPPGSPPMLTCRRYYRRLFLSGRLFTLYSALYKDLNSNGRMDLISLVNQGCFLISGNALVLRPGMQENWQARTALLFMQHAWQVSRRLLREREQARRRRFSPLF